MLDIKSFKPTYHERNVKNIAQLGDKTKIAALKFYQEVIDSKIDLLIYCTIRTEAEQRENIKNGVSQTMKSFHITGQAFDAVLIRKGDTDWNSYGSADFKKVVALAKKQKFTWGGDWKTFIDKPHFQYDAIAYGADAFKTKGSIPEIPAAAEKKPKPKPAVKPAVTKPETIETIGTIEIVNVGIAAFIVDKPNSKSKNLATIKRGGHIKISGSVPGWYEVVYDEKRAYINAKYGKRV